MVRVISFEVLINPRFLGEIGDLGLFKGLQPMKINDIRPLEIAYAKFSLSYMLLL